MPCDVRDTGAKGGIDKDRGAEFSPCDLARLLSISEREFLALRKSAGDQGASRSSIALRCIASRGGCSHSLVIARDILSIRAWREVRPQGFIL